MIIYANSIDLTNSFQNKTYSYKTHNLAIRWQNKSISATFLQSGMLVFFIETYMKRNLFNHAKLELYRDILPMFKPGNYHFSYEYQNRHWPKIFSL